MQSYTTSRDGITCPDKRCRSLIISGLSRDFLLSFGYLFQTDDIFELHATFEGIGSRHLPLMLHPLKNQTKTIKT